MTESKNREPVDMIQQNALHLETVKKEQRTQKLYTEFHINPAKKLHILTDKPNIIPRKEEEDPAVLQAIQTARLEPVKKYSHPLTEAQEIGWISTPLLASDRSDRRLHFPRQNADITKYMEAVWRSKKQG